MAIPDPISAHDVPPVAFQNLIGSSPALRQAIALGCKIAARGSMTVLIEGATGTGKELFARGIHYSSENSGEPFIAINCAAIPENLLESELFGHEKGAFSGATSSKPGLLEFAARGTVFLDEIGELPIGLQPKLLRVLEERRTRRLGALKEREISCRIVAATNRDLMASVAEGTFRDDLYYRLNVVRVEVPPLSERAGDVELLARYFVDSICRQHGLRPKKLSSAALAALREYKWPGNVRELRNAIEGALVVADGEVIEPEHVLVRRRMTAAAPISVNGTPIAAVIPIPNHGLTMEAAEKQLLETTMRLAENNRSQAARMLDVSRPRLLRLLRRYGLD